jgi:DNA-binding GntR family transcriptional regulator
MVRGVGKLISAKRAALACVLLAVLGGGGYGVMVGAGGRASADPDPPASGSPAHLTVPRACSAAVLDTLRDIAMRVYREGVSSERTASALYFIEHSIPLREAVERDDSQGARAAARALIATGHMTNLRVLRGEQTLVDAGGPNALTPLHGSILGADGEPIASFVASVWSDSGFVDETNGIAEGETALRENGRSVAGSFALPPGELPAQGALTVKGAAYSYTSFPASAYPTGATLRVYLLKSSASIAPLCGASATDTLINTLRRVAGLIYASEGGAHALTQVQRVQHNQPLLRAVAAQDPEATRLAIDSLLNEHIVRLRVSAGGRLLSDVGGPYVLAPVSAPLRSNGRRIGSIVLSIQDDEGYKRLAGRLAGLDVLMYMGSAHPQLVKNSLGPAPGAVPASGSYRYRGHTYQVFTLHAEAFPSGPLRIVVLVPIPYS